MLLFLPLVLIILCLTLQLFHVHLSSEGSSVRLLLRLLFFLGGELVIFSVFLRYITCAEYTHFYGGRKPGKDAGATEECIQ